MDAEQLFFCVFAGSAVGSAILMLAMRNALTGALCLILCFLSFAGLYTMLDAPFVAAMQVLVYAGAIMMLIVFVIMTVDMRESLLRRRTFSVGAIAAASVVAISLTVYASSVSAVPFQSAEEIGIRGTVALVGQRMFTKHVLNFEMLSLLLLVALVGALVLTKKQPRTRKES